MAKQSWKQQMMQQIANKQVQQVMQQKQAEQLQASFNAWQKEQDDIAQLQASFDAWQKENVQPVQQPVQPVQTVKKEQPKQEVIPSLADFTANNLQYRQAKRDIALGKKQREDYQKKQQEEAILASKAAMKGEAKWDRSVDNTLNMLNTDEFKDVVKKGKVQKAIEEKEQKQKTQDEMREKQIASFDKYNTDNLPQLTDEQKALEEQILNADRYVDNTPSKDRWNNRFLTAQEKADAINKTTQEDVDRWLSPDTKLTNKEKGKARAYASNEIQKMQRDAKHQPIGTEEEKQHYADMVEILNKTNPISSAMSGYMELPFNLVDMAGDAGKSVVNQIGGLGAAVTDKLGITEGATQRHNEKVEAANEAADLKEANQRRSFANAQTQYPLANTGGKFAGQVTMYALTNPVFDGIAEGAGVTNQLAKFFINQGAQNAQDLALDTAPLVKELMADGSMSDADKRQVFNNVLLNALGNAAMGTAQEIPNITKYVGKKIDAKKAADAAFRDNVLAGADKLSRLANEDIPMLQDADNVVAKATRQADEAAQNIENIARQMPEIPDEDIKLSEAELNKLLGGMEPAKTIEPPKAPEVEAPKAPEVIEPEIPRLLSDDMESQLAYDFENLGDSYYGNRAAIREALENKDFSIPNVDINEVPGKNGKMQYEIIDLDTNRKIKSFASRKAAEKAQAEYIAGDVLKEKAIKAFEDIDAAIYNYEKAAYNSADVEEVNTAKKAVEAARKRYERAMKELDPTYYDAVSSKDFGDRITRPYYTRNPAAENPIDEALQDELVNDWVKQDIENPNRFVQDANSAPKAEPIQASAPKNLEIKEVYDKKGKPRYYVAEKISENMSRPVEAKKTYKTIDEANEAVYRIKNADKVPGAEPLQTFADGQKNGDWKISKARTNTFENQGWGDQLPEKDYAYRVQSTAEQHEIKAERYRDSENIARDLLSKDFDTFDAADVKASMEEIQSLMDNGEIGTARRLSERLAHEGRESGRTIQAFKEYNKNSLSGALLDADSAQESFVLEPWRSKNKKAREGNSRIAKALADMGHKTDAKIKPELTHDQIKNGVIAELNREVGSVEQYFNDNDIEFLTQLAEDKSVPVWQITSEIEHKLNTGNWYTLDESIAMPKPTNRKLQNALNSLVTETIRTESEAPSLKQIAEEVRNTLGKESADLEGLFTDDDMDYLANLIHEGATKEELAQALDMKMATGSWGISDETLQEVNNIFKQIAQYDTNSKQFVEGQAEAYRLLANEILPNATAKEKFEAWRYIAMLGNPKTMLRNFIGNQTFNVVTGISNNVAAVAEAGIDKAARALGGEGIQRTKAVLNPIADSGLIKAAAEDADASRYRQIIGSKYEKMSKDTLRRSKSVFNSKLAQLYEKVTDAGISDYSAVKKKYSTSLAGYMKANGMDTNIFKAEDELRRLKEISNTRLLSNAEKSQMDSLTKQVADLNKARDYALKQAEYATFHEDNAIANVLSKWSRTSKEEGTGLGHVLIEGVVPFKKTPANVLKSGYEYSPLGAIRSIKKTGKLIYENTGKRAGNLADVYKNSKGKDVARTLASDVIDSWSKTLTGTGLTALGFYLYNKGILHSSDPDTKYQDQLEGHQNYAIEINGKSYTVDWAAPTIMPLMVGAEIAKLWDSTGKGDGAFYKNIDDYMNAANRLADPLIETSMLSGIKDTLETAASAAQYNETLNVPTLLAYNTITGYATQGIPTLGGQIARTIDPTRRSTYTDKEGVAGILDKQTKKLMNKIPGLSYLNEPYVDTYGREQQNSPFNNPAGNLAYQMLSPGYLSNINETGADNVSREAYAVGNTESTLPKWQSKFKDASGNRVSPENYTKASKAYGQANYEIREALAKDKWFNSLDDAQKEEIVKGINTIAQHVGNAAIDPNYSKDSKPYNAYKDGGIKGLLDYYKGQEAKNTTKDLLGDSGVTTNSKAGKAIQAAVESGDMKQAEKLAAEAKEEKAQEKQTEATKEDLSSYGLTSISPAKTYEKAQGVIPGLTMESFAKTYKAIDSDGNQGIKQDEIISYLNSHNVSESEGKKIWEAYGNKTWKKIPVLNNGKWKKSG